MRQFMATSTRKTKSSDFFILVAFVTSVERGSEMFGGLQIGLPEKIFKKKIEPLMANKYEQGVASEYAICDIGSGLISKSTKYQRVVANLEAFVGKNLRKAAVTLTSLTICT